MSGSVEKKGRTVEEAVEEALRELGIPREAAEVEVLEEPARGLLGILGPREARVRVARKAGKADCARSFLQQVARAMGVVAAQVETEEREGEVYASVTGKNPAVLIGRRGQTLDALQYLVNLAVGKALREPARVVVDVCGYRARREETLRRLARRLALRVKTTGRSVTLEPMSAHDRKVIHLALQGDPEVETYSEGKDPFRKVIIACRR